MSRDLAFISQMNQSLSANNLASQQLQEAHNLSLSRGSTATASSAGNYYSPLSNSIRTAKNVLLSGTTAGLDLPSDQQAMLQSLVKNDEVDPEKFSNIIHDVTKTAKQNKSDAENQSSKQAVVSASKAQIDPEDADIIKGLSEDPKHTAADLRVAIQNSAKKRVLKANVEAQHQEKKKMFADVGPLLSQPDQLTLAPLVEDPRVTAAQLSQAAMIARARASQGEHASANQMLVQQRFERTQAMTQMRAIEKTYPGIATANRTDFEPEERAIYDTYQRLKQAAAGGIEGGPGEGQAAMGQPAGNSQLTPQQAAHFLMQAGGDKDKARQMARQAGYTF
jgi:hypothetical protein